MLTLKDISPRCCPLGSLLSELKRRGLAFGLSCGNSGGGYEASSNFCLFELNVQLTAEGRERVEEVTSLVTHELSMLRQVRVEGRGEKEREREKMKEAAILDAELDGLVFSCVPWHDAGASSASNPYRPLPHPSPHPSGARK